MSFPMILSDIGWLSEIFNDTKHRAVSLRQPSFLLPGTSLVAYNKWCTRQLSGTRRSRLKKWLFELTLAWHCPHSPAALHFVFDFSDSVKCPCNVTHDSVTLIFTFLIIIITRGQSNLTKSASRGANSPLRGHPRGRNLYHWIPGVGFPISVP